MKLPTPQHHSAKTGRAHRLVAACIAYFATFCAVIAAAAAVVAEAGPLMFAGF